MDNRMTPEEEKFEEFWSSFFTRFEEETKKVEKKEEPSEEETTFKSATLLKETDEGMLIFEMGLVKTFLTDQDRQDIKESIDQMEREIRFNRTFELMLKDAQRDMDWNDFDTVNFSIRRLKLNTKNLEAARNQSLRALDRGFSIEVNMKVDLY